MTYLSAPDTKCRYQCCYGNKDTDIGHDQKRDIVGDWCSVVPVGREPVGVAEGIEPGHSGNKHLKQTFKKHTHTHRDVITVKTRVFSLDATLSSELCFLLTHILQFFSVVFARIAPTLMLVYSSTEWLELRAACFCQWLMIVMPLVVIFLESSGLYNLGHL